MNQWPQKLIIFTDGASRGNPGPAAVGIYVMTQDQVDLARVASSLGHFTNNYAEYTAVRDALRLALEKGAKQIQVRTDSELLVKQMKGEYKVKSANIRPLFEECRQLAREFDAFELAHVRREDNKEADRLANYALDMGDLKEGV